MSQEMIFEHPLNERIRTFLRLEHLFEKLDYFVAQPEHWCTRAAIEALLDIVAITARADIKTELLKEIDRNLSTLARVRNQPGVDPAALKEVFSGLEHAAAAIHEINGQIGSRARDDAFLKAVAQRSSIPGGACSFDVPLYHHFLTQPNEQRRARIASWTDEIDPVSEAIRLVLSLARTSATPRKLIAPEAFFQESLDSQAPAQLLRVALGPEWSVYPEISGHKNRFSIRFMQANQTGRPLQSQDDVPFLLTCCVF
ncbi:cell division protein ZapD [Lamprobacter modestohalophilus]|uniref:cell division protein ZapD n=1 Tax=Lamprobacter modestohalophilus TaxID=1064514 RepID=UPI002ADED2D1|nr:cell division protein ZapD [Lamprobacter modestohalophilus]MEA1049255.1 cell division protein ZapD [Lamprobacter modestohalophilus]